MLDGRLYAAVPGNGWRGGREQGDWESYANSSLTRWMLIFNGLGALAHLIGVILTLSLGRLDMALRVYRAVPVNNGNATHPMIESSSTLDSNFYPTWIIFWFFMLSLTFHLVISGVLISTIYDPNQWYNSWYMRGLYNCVAPWRWLEYAGSSSIMLTLTCVLLGLRDIHVIVLVTGLMAIVNVFGWLTEVHSMHFVETAPTWKLWGWELTRRWEPGSVWWRMQFHLLGYLPYGLLWYAVFDRFRLNMEVVGDSLPAFVNVATIGSFSLFTLFGIVQMINQLFPYGPSVYWLGEATYVVLSFLAKANLGFIVLFQALVEGSMYDTVMGVQ